MTKVIEPSKESSSVKELSFTKRKIGKIPPTHNVRFLKSKLKKKRG